MGSLTDNIPKPMLSLGTKTLIEHKLDILPDSVNEVILVIGYLGDKIMEYFGDSYNGKSIKYAWQHELKGTGHAVWQAKDLLDDRFLVMMGDDIYSQGDIERCLSHDWSILVKKCDKAGTGAKVELDERGHVMGITERAQLNEGDFSNAGMYVMNKKFFEYDLVKLPDKDEYGLPQTLVQVLKDNNIKVVVSEFWIQLSDPTDIKNAEHILEVGV